MIPKDPVMLSSFLNLKLRDEYDSLEALCEDMDIDMAEILSTLKAAGFEYVRQTNQVR